MLNSILCFTRFFTLSRRVYQIFDTMLDEEQLIQISSSIATIFVLVCTVTVMSILQKSMEFMIWSSTDECCLKSVNQTKEAIEAMEAKTRFVSMVSHEIRNPLNTIKGSIDCLGQMITDRGQLKILENAKIGGEILLNLVNNVLDAAKISADKIEILYQETIFLDILKKVLTINSGLLKGKELKTRVYLEENLPKTLFVDPSRLLQVLMNLVSNAIKFTHRKGRIDIYVSFCPENEEKSKLLAPIKKNISKNSPSQSDLDTTTEEMSIIETENFLKKLNLISQFQVKCLTDLNESSLNASCSEDPWEIFGIRRRSSENLEIRNDQSQGYIKVQISENGCGISDEDKKRLFVMFEKAAEGSRLVQGGSGLGLWICKQLCQRMNGDITAYSQLGKGSSFVFYLPVDIRNKSALSTSASEEASPSKLPRVLRALVVDELPTNLCLQKYTLEQQGVKVTVACNGKEAVEKFKGQGKEAYSLVFMDVDMPEMDGLMATLKIREWEVKNKVKPCEVYFMTEDLSEKELRYEFVKKGGHGSDVKCLKKPIGVEEMRLIVNSFK